MCSNRQQKMGVYNTEEGSGLGRVEYEAASEVYRKIDEEAKVKITVNFQTSCQLLETSLILMIVLSILLLILVILPLVHAVRYVMKYMV